MRSGKTSGECFHEILKERARGPKNLGPLEAEVCERAMHMILDGEATPAQVGGFLLVGRAAGDDAQELIGYTRALRSRVQEIEAPPGSPTATVTGGFDGKVRTFNVGAASALVAAAAGGRVLLSGCEHTPPKFGNTVFDALRGIGIEAPQSLDEAERSLGRYGFAAMSTHCHLPELHALLGLRREMVRRTALNVVEKLVSPVPGTRFMVGITHSPFLETVPEVLRDQGVGHALIYRAIEGSDEAPLDGQSRMVVLKEGEVEEVRIEPETLGLTRVGRTSITWTSPEDESSRLLAILEGRNDASDPVRNLLLYNAALRLWTADMGVEEAPLEHHVERARVALDSGAASGFVHEMSRHHVPGRTTTGSLAVR